MLIFVQVCRTRDKNLSVFKWSIGSEEQMGAMKYIKRKIEFQESIWRKEVLKITRSRRHQKHSHQKLFARSWHHQKLEIIRSWRLEVSKFVKYCYSHVHVCRRNGSLEQRLFQRNLKALDAYPLKSAGKGQ